MDPKRFINSLGSSRGSPICAIVSEQDSDSGRASVRGDYLLQALYILHEIVSADILRPLIQKFEGFISYRKTKLAGFVFQLDRDTRILVGGPDVDVAAAVNRSEFETHEAGWPLLVDLPR